MSWGKIGLFAGGVLLGTAGVSILSSRDAKKVYTHCTAAVLRAKDAVVDRATVIQENCSDIYEEAKKINEDREAAQAETEIFVDEEEAQAETGTTETA
ncbi:MAG: hypothetical protein IKR68_08015 [Lachnospiraceae bacterium]|nr:hypothetical protein [Lachnospiraceae bacterium]